MIDKSAANDTQARKTVLIVAIVLMAITSWNFLRGRTAVATVLGGLSAALLVAGFALPAVARRFHILWMKLAMALGYVNSRILLGVVFYGLFTPYGFVSRLLGRDPLRRRGTQGKSYWTERKNSRQSREQFERMF